MDKQVEAYSCINTILGVIRAPQLSIHPSIMALGVVWWYGTDNAIAGAVPEMHDERKGRGDMHLLAPAAAS